MKYYSHLYVTDSVKKKQKKIMERLEKNRLQNDIYLITVAASDREQLDIINSVFLLQPQYPKEDLFVVGIAKGEYEAFELVEQISRDVFAATGDLEIRKFITENEQER